MKYRFVFAALLAAAFSTPSYGQDRCGDILQSGVFNSVDVWSKSEYREIIVSRFLSSTYDSSKQSGSGIGGKSIGEIVMGNAYTESEYNTKKSTLQKSYDYSLTKTEEWSHAVRTSDPAIVSAWQNCMETASGLRTRFETKPRDGKNITLVMDFKGFRGNNQTKIKYDTIIPDGAKLLSQNQYDNCLKAGAVIVSGVTCRVSLQAPASETLKLIISSDGGDEEAYLNRRLRWNPERKNFTATKDYTLTQNGISKHTDMISISQEDIDAGYTFLSDTVKITGPNLLTAGTDGWCKNFSTKQNPTSIVYDYDIRRTDKKHSTCRIIVTADIEKGEFIPDE